MLSIVGNCKNAGKTTVLNYLIQKLYPKPIAITSIGLDGEKYDALSKLPKPRIFVYPGMIIATAKDTLKECQATYHLLYETNISSSMGNIVVIRIIEGGNCLIGGPSTIEQMEKLLLDLHQFSIEKILIDGAFFRLSLTTISEATLFVVGANYHYDMHKVIVHTQAQLTLFSIQVFESEYLKKQTNITLIDCHNHYHPLQIASLLEKDDVWQYVDSHTTHIYIPHAITSTFIQKWLKLRRVQRIQLIVKYPTHIVISDALLKRMMRYHDDVFVLYPSDIVGLCFNPYAVKGYTFDNDAFEKELQQITDLPIFNVKRIE